jgi:hypothetical protein
MRHFLEWILARHMMILGWACAPAAALIVVGALIASSRVGPLALLAALGAAPLLFLMKWLLDRAERLDDDFRP